MAGTSLGMTEGGSCDSLALLAQRLALRLQAVAHAEVRPFSHLMQAAMHYSRLLGTGRDSQGKTRKA